MRTNTPARRIRRIRSRLGLTQEEFGHLLGVCRASVALWESGNGYPNFKNWRKIEIHEDQLERKELDNGRKRGARTA